MVALIISVLMNWNSGFGRRVLGILIGCFVLAGIFTRFHPDLFLGGTVLIFAGIGLWTGKWISNNVPVATWIRQAGLRPWRIVIGGNFSGWLHLPGSFSRFIPRGHFDKLRLGDYLGNARLGLSDPVRGGKYRRRLRHPHWKIKPVQVFHTIFSGY